MAFWNAVPELSYHPVRHDFRDVPHSRFEPRHIESTVNGSK